MSTLFRYLFFFVVLAGIAAAVPAFVPSVIWPPVTVPAYMPAPDAQRGRYIMQLAGCASCHTAPGKDAKPLAGGRELETPYGVFAVPNITPDKATGLGNWTETDFIGAMTHGLSPAGRHYYPAFPYTSYTGMTLLDLRDLWAHLKTVPAVRRANDLNRLRFPYDLRPGVGIWKAVFFRTGRFRPDPARTPSWNRGAYIVTALAHCGECHTPRNIAGAPKRARFLAGSPKSDTGEGAPNITPHQTDGIGRWSKEDIVLFLESGITPTGDAAGGAMGHVIRNTTSKMTAADRAAVADFLRTVKPQPDAPGPAAKGADGKN